MLSHPRQVQYCARALLLARLLFIHLKPLLTVRDDIAFGRKILALEAGVVGGVTVRAMDHVLIHVRYRNALGGAQHVFGIQHDRGVFAFHDGADEFRHNLFVAGDFKKMLAPSTTKT